jgi:parvulin-like peptidyl-prolyl isomerase
MKLPGKAIAAIAVVAMLGGAAIFMQNSSSTAQTIKMTSRDLELIANELMPPQQRARLASDPEAKKNFLKSIKTIFALGQIAEQEDFDERPETKNQIAFQIDLVLSQAYKKKNPDTDVSEEEGNSYAQAHPNEWNDFLEANPRFKQQAEEIKKEFLQIKVMAERARREGLDKEEVTRLSIRLQRSQVLADAYIRELQKNPDKLIPAEDVEQYYNENKDEFQEVRARHILVSTRAEEEIENPHEKTGEKKPPQKKAPTKEEARAKAQSLLDRIRKGEDFAKLAQENSDDPGSKTKGGDLDFFSKGDMVPEFDQTAFSMNPGQVSDLVESQFGYHIIRVEEKRTAALDEKTREKIKGKLFEKKVEEKVNKAKVEVAEDFNIDAAPPATPTKQ